MNVADNNVQVRNIGARSAGDLHGGDTMQQLSAPSNLRRPAGPVDRIALRNPSHPR